MQKLSIIRFKPKPRCLDEFAANLSAYNETKHRSFPLNKIGEELHAIVIRDANILAQDTAKGVTFLDSQRHFYRNSIP